MSLLLNILGGAVIGFLPGAVIFRLPIAERGRRAQLSAEERLFWQVIVSLSWSLLLLMAMAAAGVYRYDRLIAANGAVSLVVIAGARRRLLWRGEHKKPTISVLAPLILLLLGAMQFFPAAEYVIGGKDPGVYVNEGFAIARTGKLFRQDEVVAKVPEADRDLFFRSHQSNMYYGLRFMGVYINNPSTGDVISQFPHAYPASIAIGYSLGGAIGAINIVSLWAVLGVLAVYFFGSRLIGRLPAAFAAGAMALNVIEVWFGRYPNTEVQMQALLFAGLLAVARSHQDGDRFFGWVAGTLFVLLLFLRLDAALATALLATGLGMRYVLQAEPPRLGLVVLVATGSGLAWRYYQGPMAWYSWIYREHLPSEGAMMVLIAIAIAVAVGLRQLPRYLTSWLVASIPIACAVLVSGLAVYGLFVREPAGPLADYDAYSLRTYRDAYVLWPALIAGIAGYAMLARRNFWRDPAFFLIAAGYSVFFFYKIRVVPEQWWMARRFLPVILPATLLFASAAVFGLSTPEHRRTVRRAVAAILVMGFIGWQYATAAKTVAKHSEYKGAIAQVDKLAGHFTPRDLVIVESRNAGGDHHVLALPLAYEYGLQVLVLESPVPDRRQFESFLVDASKKYERVFFVGGGGTDLLSRHVTAVPVAFTPFTVPEFETTDWKVTPKTVRTKDLGYSLFQLKLGNNAGGGFDLDVGYFDDLNVIRFFARQVMDGRSYRWTGRQSRVVATGLTGNEHIVELVLHDGGRPKIAPPATLDVFFDETALGRINVGSGFETYRLAIPPDAARAAGERDAPAQLRLVSSTWSPHDYLGGSDTRELGVMVDRVVIR